MIMTELRPKIDQVRQQIDAAAKRSGRSLADIAIVAVTKNAKVEAIAQAKEAGIAIFAENRIQDALEKVPQVPGEWHMIGHLQSNKIKDALQLFQMIQSVDALSLAEKLNAELLAQNRVFPVLLEVNISGEEQKYGFMPEEVYSAIDQMMPMQGIRVLGLMGIASNLSTENVKRETFKKLKGIFSACKMLKHPNIEMKFLSMGMSDDFEIAIEEGSNMVRIGRALFA